MIAAILQQGGTACLVVEFYVKFHIGLRQHLNNGAILLTDVSDDLFLTNKQSTTHCESGSDGDCHAETAYARNTSSSGHAVDESANS